MNYFRPASPEIAGKNLEAFEALVSNLRLGVASGTLSPSVVESGLEYLSRGHALRREFPVWKTVQYGVRGYGSYWNGGNIAKTYLHALNDRGYRVASGPLHSLIFHGFGFPEQEETEADLALLTVADLGLAGRTSHFRVCERARELGLKLCPPQTAPALRLAYPDQPCGEWIVVMSQPVQGVLMRVGRGVAGLLIDGLYIRRHNDLDLGPDQLLVFEIPKNPG